MKEDPTAGWSKPYRECSRDRTLTDGEISAVWRAADEMGYPYGAIIQLLFLSGKRLREISDMRWQEIDLDTGQWVLPGERTKNGREHAVRLGPWATDIVKRVPQLDETFVFPSRRVASATAFSGFSKAKRKLDALSGVTNWRVHDIRRVFSTHMAELGVPLQVIEKLLTHTSGSLAGVAGIYNRYEYAEDMYEAQVEWEQRLREITGLNGG